MGRCAVAVCSNTEKKSGISLFRFPASKPSVLAVWKQRCGRKGKFNVKNARICSEHFLDSDYDPSFRVKASLMPNVKPWLKEDAIPSQKLSSSSGDSG